jgi:ferrous iron transport protein A
MKAIDLTRMKPGQKGRVIEIQGGRGMMAKLQALGIRPGVEITMRNSQIMRGPVVVGVGQAQVAIGFGMARRITVEVADDKP